MTSSEELSTSLTNYLATKPLAFEITVTLTEGSSTTSEIAEKLNRGLSTVYKTLDEMEQKGFLIKEKKQSDKRKTYFSLVDLESSKKIVQNQLALSKYAVTSQRLRGTPIFLLQNLENNIFKELKKWYEIFRIQRPISEEGYSPDFIFEIDDTKYYLDIKRLRSYSEYNLNRLIGDIVRYTLDDNVSGTRYLVLLLPSNRNLKFENYIKNVANKLSSQKHRINLIIENIEDRDMLNNDLINRIIEQINDVNRYN